RVTKDMQQNMTQREQGLTSHLSTVKDTLTNHTSIVENTFNQKLDAVIRNMDQGLYTITDGISRELIEMRRASEEMNQNHMRLVQQSLQEFTRELQILNRQISLIGQQPVRTTNTIGMNRDEF